MRSRTFIVGPLQARLAYCREHDLPPRARSTVHVSHPHHVEGSRIASDDVVVYVGHLGDQDDAVLRAIERAQAKTRAQAPESSEPSVVLGSPFGI